MKDYKQALSDHWDMQEYAEDFIDTFTNEEIAQMVRERVMTIEEVEAGLRRAQGRKV